MVGWHLFQVGGVFETQNVDRVNRRQNEKYDELSKKIDEQIKKLFEEKRILGSQCKLSLFGGCSLLVEFVKSFLTVVKMRLFQAVCDAVCGGWDLGMCGYHIWRHFALTHLLFWVFFHIGDLKHPPTYWYIVYSCRGKLWLEVVILNSLVLGAEAGTHAFHAFYWLDLPFYSSGLRHAMYSGSKIDSVLAVHSL